MPVTIKPSLSCKIQAPPFSIKTGALVSKGMALVFKALFVNWMGLNYKHVVKKSFLIPVLLLVLCLAFSGSFGQSLTSIPGLVLWLRADMGIDSLGDSISTWHDQSGLGNDAVATPGNQPRLVNAPTLNNKPTVLFNGTSDFFTGQQIAALNNNGSSYGTYIFMVTKGNTQTFTGSVTSAGLFTIGNQGTGLLWERSSGLGDLFVSNQNGDPPNDYVFSNTAIPSGGATFPYKLLEVRKTEGSAVGLYANANLAATRSNASMDGPFTNAPYNLAFALGTTNYFSGEIAEIVVFNGATLNGAQIQQVENYLGTKYSPTVHIGPRDTVITQSVCALPLTAPTGFISYLWSTGATTNSISVTTSGTYSLILKDQFGGLQYDTTTVTFPSVSLPAGPVTLCQGGTVQLTPNIGALTNCTFNWSSGQTTSNVNISSAGTFRVTVTDGNHCTAVTNYETVAVDAFRSTISLGPAASHCSGNRIGLTSPLSSWGRLQFNWSNGSADSVIVLGPNNASYSVTVTDTNSCSGTASVSVTITGVAPHVTFSGASVCFGQVFSPYNLSDSAFNFKYLWNFGDGSATDTLCFPTHSYTASGIYPVHLTVTNPTNGCVNDTVIPAQINALPGAAFQTGLVCTSDPSYTFIDLSHAAMGQNIVSWNWQFGDSLNSLLFDTSTLQNPTHNFSAVPDTYLITLTIRQANSCSATTSNLFIVELPPGAPSSPLLEFPANGSVSATDSITFGWQAAPGAVLYKLEISTDPSFSHDDSIYLNIYTNQKGVKLSPNQTYYWQVTAFNPCGDVAYSIIDTVNVISPMDIDPSNLALWLEADSGVVLSGNNVTQWADISVNRDSAVASSPGQPTFLPKVPLLNYKPSIKFGPAAVMNSLRTLHLGSGSFSIFVVAKTDATLTGEPAGIFTMGQLYNGMWIERLPGGGFSAINTYIAYGDPSGILKDPNLMPDRATPYELYSTLKNFGTSILIDTNGVFDVIKANSLIGSAFTDTSYILGHMAGTDPFSNNIPYGYMNGEIAEIIVYNTLLNNSQQQTVNNYIFNKYAPPVNLGPDIVQSYSLCPVVLNTGKRFVSYLWSTGATSDSLIVTQSGRYWVQTTDVFNHISSDTINVTLPYRGSNPDTDYVCHGDTGQIIQLINSPNLYNYVWYDSISPSSVINLNINSNTIHPYSAGYYYTRITDSSHCSFITKKIPLVIDNFYTAQLLPALDTICKFGSLTINPVPYTLDSFLWQPIADTTSAPTVDSSGIYYLYTVDNHGCRNTDSTRVTTRAQAPSVNFTIPNYCLTNSTYFVDSSFAAPNGDSIRHYYWNYGGGIPSTDTTVNGQTSYKINYGYGNYTVSLIVTTDSGCYGIKTKHITILPSPNAGYSDSANNSVYPYILCAGAGSSLQLTDTSSAIGGSPIVQRVWKFNNVVNTNTTSNIQYTFPNQGVYNITLEVVNALGCADSITQRIDVHAPFVAEFAFDNHCLGDYTTFRDETRSLSIVRRIWKFRENGDGPYAYTPTTQILFNSPNTYDVELQVQNAIGCIATKDTMVKIVEKPVANFSGLIGCQDHYYAPLDSSVVVNDHLVNWHWNIDGHIFNRQNPRLLLNSTALFNVSLVVTSDLGCVDSITKTVEVGGVPTALFAFNPLYGTAPLPVNFINRSSGATHYVWDYGDGSLATSALPQINPAPHTYTQNGNYNVTLYAYNDYDCYDSLIRTINVIPTDLDIAVQQVNAYPQVQADGSELVKVVTVLTNLGTRVIVSAQLYATFGNVEVLEQNWSGYLPSGQSIVDTFPAQFVAPAGHTNSYVCVNVREVNGGETEITTDNNQNCNSLTGTMQLAGPSPNPAINECQLGIILPKAGSVYVGIYDALGNIIIPEFLMNLPAERTNYNIPIGQLQGGEYFIRVRYNDDTEVRNFVVR